MDQAICPAIRATCNAAGMAKNIVHAILYGLLEYQGIGVKSFYFLQGIIHIITFLNEAACNSSTGKLLQLNVEFFRVEMGTLFFLFSTTYNKNPVLPICLLAGTRTCRDSFLIFFSSLRLPKITQTSQSSATKMSILCKPLLPVVLETRN